MSGTSLKGLHRQQAPTKGRLIVARSPENRTIITRRIRAGSTSVGATTGTMGGIPASLGQPGHPYRSPLIQEPPRMDRLTSCRTFITRRRAGLLVPVLAVLIGGCT